MNETTKKKTNEQGDSQQDAPQQDDAVIGIALKWSLVVILILAVLGGGMAYWFSSHREEVVLKETENVLPQVREQTPLAIPVLPFRDITTEAGIAWRHVNGAAGAKLLPETMGGGCAFFDYDNDGDQDLLLVNSNHWPDQTPKNSVSADAASAACALYANMGDGRFEDVSQEAGMDVSLYGMGVAVGDYDNDGYVDVFLSALGANRLLHNNKGKFEDVTQQAGVAGADSSWSTGCGWFDCDQDGDLDLFVCQYLAWSPEFDQGQDFRLTGGGRAYGRPQAFPGAFPTLYRNDGAAGFVDISQQAGIQVANRDTQAPLGKSLGLAFTDFDRDGRLDVLVTNDTVQNFLFHNEGGGRFRETALAAGVAYDSQGRARGAMGVDIAHFRNGPEIGVAIGNFSNEMTALYVADDQSMLFTDQAISSGLGPVTRLELTFGLRFFDADLDGRLDLIAANGHLEDEINKVQPSQHYQQPPQLLWNCGPENDTEFTPVPAGPHNQDLTRPLVGRGVICADIDADGDLDLLITAIGQKPRLLRNDQQTGHHWLRLKLVGRADNRDAIGAEVEVRAGEHTWRRLVSPTRGYLSQSELPLTFGLGKLDAIDAINITWPNGQVQKLEGLPVDRMHAIEQAERS